ncbi:peptide methionine sulfoxide reductase [Gelidibacter algens]|nr:peptide methionine sulfoxide reductase [Gelidibacter algens]
MAFGGGCSRSEASESGVHRSCFSILKAVEKVEQGYVASTNENSDFSEAVIVHFNRKCITLQTLVEIHLLTHNSKSNHSMRKKYRSAIYTFNEVQFETLEGLLREFQKKFNGELITQILPFKDFEPSRAQITNYYFKNPEKPFCETFINPKLKLLLNQFSGFVNQNKVGHLKN